MSSPAPASPPVKSPPAAPPPTNTTSPPPSPVDATPPKSAAIPPHAAPPPLPNSPPPPIPSPAPPPTPETPAPPPKSSPPATPPTTAPSTPPPPPTPSTPATPTPVTPSNPPPHPTPETPSIPPPPPTRKTPSTPPSPPLNTPPPPQHSPPPPSSRTSPLPPPPLPRKTLPPLSPFKPSQSGGGDSGSKISVGIVVLIAVAGVAILALLSFLFLFCKKKKKRKHLQDNHGPPPPGPIGDHVITVPSKFPLPPGGLPRHPPPSSPPPAPVSFVTSSGGSGSMFSDSQSPRPPISPGIAFAFSTNAFRYEQLAIATDGFSDANLLGQGGFGYVHKGVLPNGIEVAVKQLKVGSGQGEREFQAEVEVISRVHHKHLVSLVGYCIAGSQRLLVYEFVPNNTLEFHLHGQGRPLDWSTRLKIALGAAKGLAYLHEDCHPKIIHRDIKASNILLNFNFEPMVADFGLAKFTSDANTHVSTRVMGTFGYLAPEYASSGKLTDKSDVFSFGVVLLELITGRRPVDSQHTYMDDSLVDWARPILARAIDEDNFDVLLDPRLQDEYNHKEMACIVACASACVRYSARRRPRLSQVVRALEGDVSLSDLSDVRSGHNTISSSHGSSDYDTTQYKENMNKFKDLALRSKECGSSEYSEPTSEYGLNPSGSSSEAQSTREVEIGNFMKKDGQGLRGGS